MAATKKIRSQSMLDLFAFQIAVLEFQLPHLLFDTFSYYGFTPPKTINALHNYHNNIIIYINI